MDHQLLMRPVWTLQRVIKEIDNPPLCMTT